ncbi:MAG: hypothetical protein AAFQ75_11905, partial [Pseudomonadota bacterium]
MAPAITSVVSEFDAALLVGMSADEFSTEQQGVSAVRRGHDFAFRGLRYQVKANRPSGKPGSTVRLVAKAKNYEWDRLIWVHYTQRFEIFEAWVWPVDDYRRQFQDLARLGPTHMRQGERLVSGQATG